MIKSGLIIGGAGLILGLFASLLSPVCSPCVALLLGLAAGFMVGVYERPLISGDAARQGAGGGAIAGSLLIVGGLIAAAINANAMETPGGQAFREMLGLPAAQSGEIWAIQILLACCLGLINLALMTGLGAAGGAIWFSWKRDEAKDEPIPPAI
jgi:hypothetical protein